MTTPRRAPRQPSQTTPVRVGGRPGGRRLSFGQQGQAIGNYLRDVRSELRKVVWPTRRQALNLTAVTLAFSLAVGIFLGGFDFLFQELFRLVLRTFNAGG